MPQNKAIMGQSLYEVLVHTFSSTMYPKYFSSQFLDTLIYNERLKKCNQDKKPDSAFSSALRFLP